MRLLYALVILLGLATPATAQQSCPCTTVNTCNGNCAGSECCQFGCTDFGSDPFNCGSCGNNCGASSDCVNSVCVCTPGTVRACYTGPFGTEGVGRCLAGTQTCDNANTFSACNDTLPTAESCNNVDDDCDGRTDNVAGTSAPLTQACYDGPSGTNGVPPCRGGTAICQGGAFGACLGEVVPTPANPCGAVDAGTPPGDGGFPADSGSPADGGFAADAGFPADGGSPPADGGTGPDGGPCPSGDCYSGPPGTEGVGACHGGALQCAGTCAGAVLPEAPRCGPLDHDCDGAADTACPASGDVCSNGICVLGVCGGEVQIPCPTGYACTGGACVAVDCAGAGPCPAGQQCVLDVCTPPCEGNCAPGEACFAERCVPDDCTSFGCLTGNVCVAGVCEADPCAGVTCGATELCRGGTCSASCADVVCPAGQRCDADAQCVADACAGVQCGAGEVCVDGTCEADPCSAVTCPPAQVCRLGACVADPCDGVSCPGESRCTDGQCYSAVTAPPPGGGGPHGPPGCGCGAGAEGSACALLGVALLATGRRRRR